MTIWHLSEIISFGAGTPLDSISFNSFTTLSTLRATPLPMMFMTSGWHTPDGSVWSANLPYLFLIVWPAFAPP